MTTALLLAAALVMGQSEAASVPAAPPAPEPSVVVPTAPQPAPAPYQPAPASTGPQPQLEQPSSVRPFEMPAAPPPGPVPYADASDPKAPVKVEDYHRSYEGPKDQVEAYYDAGVRDAYQAEQALHGGLDGMWILSAAGGTPILSLDIADPGAGDGQLGGAWRDLSRPHDPSASGLIDEMVRDGRGVTLRIRLHGDGPAATLRLTQAADGRWRGQLQDVGAPRSVVLDREPI